jgi:hypothetical protein
MALTFIRLQVLTLKQCLRVDVEFAEAMIPKHAIVRHDEENLRRVIQERSIKLHQLDVIPDKWSLTSRIWCPIAWRNPLSI